MPANSSPDQPNPSISRTFARWAADLTYDDVPAAVVDKVKAIVLLAGHSALLGCETESSLSLVAMVGREEAKPDGAHIVTTDTRVSRQAAVLASTKIMEASGLWDSYRMITHPAAAMVATALVNAELEGRTGKEVITALAAGYEVTCRLAYDFVPSVAARAFRPAPIFAVMGASLVAGLLLGHDEDTLVSTLALAANGAAGLNESGRVGSADMTMHDPQAARHATFAALAAPTLPRPGSEHIMEGAAGFYRAYTGSSTGALTYVFEGPRTVDLATLTQGLGDTWKMLQVMFRVYDTAGFNQPVIELMSQLKNDHGLDHRDIAQVEVHMNYLETQYPSPEFPRHADWNAPGTGTTHFFAACAAVHGYFPQVGEHVHNDPRRAAHGGTPSFTSDPEVLEFLTSKVTLVPRYDYPMFSPTITVHLTDGRQISGHYPYEQMAWDFDQVTERLRRSRDSLGERIERADLWHASVGALEAQATVAPLLRSLSSHEPATGHASRPEQVGVARG